MEKMPNSSEMRPSPLEIATPCLRSRQARKTRLARAPMRIASGTRSRCRSVVKSGSRPRSRPRTTPAPTADRRRCGLISCQTLPRRSSGWSIAAPDGVLWRRLQEPGGIATMPVEMGHDGVQHLIAAGAYLLDVREREGYDAQRLPGAVSLPIKSLDRETTVHLDRNRPVITYCWEWT